MNGRNFEREDLNLILESMRRDRKKFLLISTSIRVISVLTAGFVIAAVLLINENTFSYFSHRAEASVEVRTAAVEDIIETIDTQSDKEGNTNAIKINRTNNLQGYNPVVFFSIEGPAEEYILHIDSVKLDSNQTYIIPVEPTINLYQWTKLLFSGKKKINGKIKLKYLNEYLDETINISFTKEYLLDRISEKIQVEEAEDKSEKASTNNESRGQIVGLMTYMARQITWKEADVDSPEKDKKDNNRGKASIKSMDVPSRLNSLVALNEEPLQKEGIQMAKEQPIMETVTNEAVRLELTQEQTTILDVVVPQLTKYLDKTYDYIESLIEQLNERIREIAGLNIRIAGLEDEVEQLEESNRDMEKAVSRLQDSNSSLKNENRDLRDEIQSLREELKAQKQADSIIVEEPVEAIENMPPTGGGTQQPNEEITEPSEDEEIAEPSEDEEIAEPSEDEEITEPSEDEEITEPSEDEEITEPSEDEETTEPSEDEEITEPSDDEEIAEPSDDQEIAEPTDEEEIAEPSEDEEIAEPSE
ncbi:MAG: hypothetical protein AB7G87_10260, partial [Clostridia bacterium]